GTKAAAHCVASIESGKAATWRLRLSNKGPQALADPFARFDEIVTQRIDEADDFYESVIPHSATADEAQAMRQALGGMLWSKQYYYLDAVRWLSEHGEVPFSASQSTLRNHEWAHMVNADVISMPDKWEYPWYAAWDLAFHAVALSSVDVDFA